MEPCEEVFGVFEEGNEADAELGLGVLSDRECDCFPELDVLKPGGGPLS